MNYENVDEKECHEITIKLIDEFMQKYNDAFEENKTSVDREKLFNIYIGMLTFVLGAMLTDLKEEAVDLHLLAIKKIVKENKIFDKMNG